MSFVERIISLFKGSTNGHTTSNGTVTMSRSTSTSAATNNPFKIHVPIRIDSMAISNDLRTFYLIDSGSLITFPLDTPSGLIIGNLSGKLTFAAQNRSSDSTAIKEDGSPENQFIKQATESFASADAAETNFELPLGDAPIWTPSYLPEENIIAIIGISNVVGLYEPGDSEEKLTGFAFTLSNNLIKIFKQEKSILVNSQRGQILNTEVES